MHDYELNGTLTENPAMSSEVAMKCRCIRRNSRPLSRPHQRPLLPTTRVTATTAKMSYDVDDEGFAIGTRIDEGRPSPVLLASTNQIKMATCDNSQSGPLV